MLNYNINKKIIRNISINLIDKRTTKIINEFHDHN